jgi:N-methylhydantoinase A/oxoprolinase/acetone carboxylase beta subunit
MAVRIGVDVGGTFTKAVACDPAGVVVARCVLPTTHRSDIGVAAGVVATVEGVVAAVEERGLGPAQLVAHSTTQAVNSLLEGDTAVVGVLGIGGGPDARRARSRTKIGTIGIAPGRDLTTIHRFLDVSRGFDPSAARAAVEALLADGAEALVVSESFGVDDTDAERAVLEIAQAAGIPACAGHEMTGAYGLQLRTVTGALNASILPTAARAANAVKEAAETRVPGVPLLVMRGDGGAAPIDSLGRKPLLTAFSGPAASVVGALRHLSLVDALIVEVGGTSTNVSLVAGGRPVLSYVRVLHHLTSVRSLDVRVAGVAGGSLLRLGRRLGRRSVVGVGPRSAHIAGLDYCSFAGRSLAKGRVLTGAPRAGDPADYAIIETADGAQVAPTITCAANALGSVPGSTAAVASDPEAARAGVELLGAELRMSARAVAERAIALAADEIAQIGRELVAEYGVRPTVLVGLGGGAGALVPSVAERLGVAWEIPPDAEVISSIGDALSMVRVEIERTLIEGSTTTVAQVVREAEAEAIAAGAAAESVQVETVSVPSRNALRAVALGAVALEESGGADLVADDVRRDAAVAITGPAPASIASDEPFSVFGASAVDDETERPVAVVDRWGSVAWSGACRPIVGTGAQVADRLPDVIRALARRVGPVTIAPSLVLIRGTRLIDLALLSKVEPLIEVALEECRIAESERVIALVSRGR